MRQQESIEYKGGDETKARKRTRARARPKPRPREREKEREKAYGGIPSLPGHPRELPHFPFSSRVCPMLLRFRVGSGPTEPPSLHLARFWPLHFLRNPSLRPHAALVPATRTILPTRDWPGGGVWWLCVHVRCACTCTLTHAWSDRCLHPIHPLLKYRPFVFSLSPAFPPHPFGP